MRRSQWLVIVASSNCFGKNFYGIILLIFSFNQVLVNCERLIDNVINDLYIQKIFIFEAFNSFTTTAMKMSCYNCTCCTIYFGSLTKELPTLCIHARKKLQINAHHHITALYIVSEGCCLFKYISLVDIAIVYRCAQTCLDTDRPYYLTVERTLPWLRCLGFLFTHTHTHTLTHKCAHTYTHDVHAAIALVWVYVRMCVYSVPAYIA